MNQINIIENYISDDTAKFLCDVVGPNTIITPDPGVMGGPSKTQFDNSLKLGNPIGEYTTDKNYNIAIDILTMLSTSIAKTISDHYDNQYVTKTIFYNKMISGAKNVLHMDNYYLNSETNEFLNRNMSHEDKSAILYLNNGNEYEGGEIHFPLQDLKLKPKAGTLIFFEGGKNLPHEVFEIVSGERHNIISFFWKKEYVDTFSGASIYQENEKPITIEDLKGHISSY